ncbi:hypothetical protein CA603_46180 [Paraburkholderia hospita]|nr:hypothetical protein CA603_46180 [Paraburkholderia hospita]
MALAAGVTGFPPIGLSAELRGGGGSTIATEYIASKNKGDRLVLCVLDSDVRYPDGPSNAWSQAIKLHDANHPSALTSSEIIDVYSIENLFPLSCLPDLKPYKVDENAAFALSKDLPVLHEHAKQPYWRYIRLKNGVSCGDLRDSGELGKFWSKHKLAFDNFSSKKCKTPPDACKHDCARNPRFRENTLQAFVERYEEAPAAELKSLHAGIPAHIAGHFDSLARVIASWMCFGKSVSGVAAA